MAPTIREVLATSNSNTTGQTLTTGSGTTAGDLIVVVQGTDNTTVSAPTSTAGTLTQVGTTETDGNGNGQLKVFTTTAASGGAKDVVFPAAGGFDIFGIVLVMQGACTTDGFAKTHFTSSGTSFATPTATLTETNDLMVVCGYGGTNATFDFTGSGLTQQAQPTAAPFSFMAAATAATVSSGTSPSYTVATTGASKPGFVVFGVHASTGSVSGTMTAALGGLTATMTGVRTVNATMAATLGGLTATMTGTRTVTGTMAASLGGLTAAMVVDNGPAATTGGWNELLAISQYARQLREEDDNRTPTACPLCGEPLRAAPHGGLYCPWGDGYRWGT